MMFNFHFLLSFLEQFESSVMLQLIGKVNGYCFYD